MATLRNLDYLARRERVPDEVASALSDCFQTEFFEHTDQTLYEEIELEPNATSAARLSIESRVQLLNALREAFSDYESLRELTEDKLNVRLVDITYPTTQPMMIREVVDYFESRGRIADLLREAMALRPRVLSLQVYGEALLKQLTAGADWYPPNPAVDPVPYRSAQKSVDEPTTTSVRVVGPSDRRVAAGAVPSSTLSGRLQALYDAQSRKVHELGLRTRDVRPKGLADIIAFATASIRVTIPAFRNSDDVGSWIGSHSLPMQLLTQSHLTVDLTLEQLRKERPFGIPFKSLFELADSGHLFLNLRDYDSNFAAHCEDERVAGRVDRLLTEIPTKLYIGSALRKAVFDAALEYSGYEERQYDSFYERARADLAAAYDAYQRLPLENACVKRSLFRGERPLLTPVCWHWAYLSSVSHYLPADIIRIDDDDAKLNVLYRKAVEYGDSARQDPSDVKNEAAANAFAELAGQLRICHLSFTAPITASYGTTYNMTQDEYRESLRLGFYWDRRAPSLRDDDLNRFLYFALSEAGEFANPTFSRLHELPDHAVLKNKIDDHILTMGDIDSLVGALTKNRQRIAEASAIMKELKTSYLTDNRPAPRQLEAWIADYRRIKADNMNVCQTALSEKWEDLVVPAEEGGVDPSSPWVETLGEDPEKLLLRPAEHRAIYRVYHVLSSRNQRR